MQLHDEHSGGDFAQRFNGSAGVVLDVGTGLIVPGLAGLGGFLCRLPDRRLGLGVDGLRFGFAGFVFHCGLWLRLKRVGVDVVEDLSNHGVEVVRGMVGALVLLGIVEVGNAEADAEQVAGAVETEF